MNNANITLQIVKELTCDVLVVGGGVAGVATAVSASREGADTLIMEQSYVLGGTASLGLVGPFMTSYTPDSKTQLIRGFFDEFVRRMEEIGGAIHPSRCERTFASYTAYRTHGHQNLTPYSAEAFRRVADDMCAECGVRVLFGATFLSGIMENGKVTSAIFATKAGLYRVTPKVVVDTTGDADVVAGLGLETVYGDGDGDVQASSLFFTVRGVDKEAMEQHMQSAPDMETRFYMREIEAERERGNYPLYRAKVMLFEGIDGEWVVNMTQMDGVDARSPEEVSHAMLVGRRQIVYVMNFLKKYVAGCENIVLSRSAGMLGVRESRRIVSEYVLKTEDAVHSTRFADEIFCASNSMDIHKKGYVEYIPRDSNAPYFIPYRSLVVKGVDNLLGAGRLVGAERPVAAAIRVMPPCMAMGQAAGIAAAISAKENIACRDVNAALLRTKLKKWGAYLPD
ncbi:MAG: FAD-dependent oxidoreductase [Clostridia bacterium]|nr:FAD-dependent oxidoreductase [Clostridia bacterium]